MRLTITFYTFLLLATSCTSKRKIVSEITLQPSKKVIVAYVTSWNKDIPDTRYVTHINYAFGHVTEDFSGIKIDNSQRLRDLVSLKNNAPELKVMLSIGGWGSGRFSEMAGLKTNRKKFSEDCLRVVREFGIDGIDIDWEYPTSNSAGISSSPHDTQNYTLLIKDIRAQIGKEKLLTLASIANAKYIDFRAIEPVIDFVNIMTYDMGNPPYHQAGLYRSKYTQGLSVNEAVNAHLSAGVPLSKLVLGIPFYGHGKGDIPDFIDYKEIIKLTGFIKQWDDVANARFLEDANGKFVCTYDNPQSIELKCNYIIERKMLGAMYWEYSGDTEEGILRRKIFDTLK